MSNETCLLCDPEAADDALHRSEVWSDRLWRLTMSVRSEVLGLSYLEPRRHVPHLADLSGDEAATLGPVLARTSNALRDATKCELVYVYVFGEGIAHLHLHLAPHSRGDALNDQIVRGAFVEREGPGGSTEIVSADFPLLPEDEIRQVARTVQGRLDAATSG
jgi:diadenosine tetraphosphate (Ap4A) HIT family hydrolase